MSADPFAGLQAALDALQRDQPPPELQPPAEQAPREPQPAAAAWDGLAQARGREDMGLARVCKPKALHVCEAPL